MDVILVPLSLFFVGWAIRSICIKKQNPVLKLIKSCIAGIYFLCAGGMATEGDKISAAIVMMAIGAALIWYSNRNYVEPTKSNDEILREYDGALKEFDLSHQETKSKAYRSTNHAKGRDVELTAVAFCYVNGSGESSFRDVDVKKFDGQYIEGYCHLSHAFKTFRLDRVEGDVILRGTGEAMDAYHWAAEMEVI